MLGASEPRSGRRAVFLALVAALGVGSWAASARAALLVITFDPTGSGNLAGAFQVATFDEAAGSTLAVGGQTAINNAAAMVSAGNPTVTTGPFPVLYEATMANLLNTMGTGIYAPGVSGNPAITVIARFNETATLTYNPAMMAPNTSITFDTNTSQAGSFFAIYSGSTPNPSTGVGFNNGTLIYYGSLVPGSGTANFTNNGNSGNNLSDASGSPTQQTVNGVGGANNLLIQTVFNLLIQTVFANSGYFPNTDFATILLNYNGAQNLPFGNNPAATAFYMTTPGPPGSGSGVPDYTRNLGAVNGAFGSGPDVEFSSDGNTSFQSIPEPGTFPMALCAVGMVSLVARRARRRRQAAA